MPEAFQYISVTPIIELDDWDVADEPLGGSRAAGAGKPHKTQRHFSPD
ncbi:MAG: hypothetical protein AAF216_14360 [Pseudomonadota bacterium]